MNYFVYPMIAITIFCLNQGVSHAQHNYFPRAYLVRSHQPSSYQNNEAVKGSGGVGIGYNKKDGLSKSHGPYASFMGHYYHEHNNTAPLIFVSGGGTANVLNYDQITKAREGNLGATGDAFFAYTMNQDNGLYLGATTHADFNFGVQSNSLQKINLMVGPEVGLKLETNGTVLTLGGSAGAGHQHCSVRAPNGQLVTVQSGPSGTLQEPTTYDSDDFAYAGIGRLMVGDRIYANVMYINYPIPKQKTNAILRESANGNLEKLDVQQGSWNLSGTLFWKVRDGFELMASCALGKITTQSSEYGTLYKRHRDFQIGFIQLINP